MQQNNRGTYKKESLGQMFIHSCLGQFIILVGVMVVLLIVAYFTVPTDKTMKARMAHGIRLCIEENAIAKSDKIDDAVRNMTAIFSTPDSVRDSIAIMDFYKYNRMEVYRHTFYSTVRVHNYMQAEGIRTGIGVFGMVIPTINFSDIILHVGPIRKEYNQQIIKNVYGDDEYFGNNPDLGNTFNTYEGGGSGER